MPERKRTESGAGSRTGGRGKSGKKGDGLAGGQPPKTGRGAAGATKAAGRTKEPNLKKDLRDFASGRPEGWNHEDWLDFLESLKNRGHDIRDREAIGVALEKERLDLALSKVKGVGPQRRKALVERYGTIWDLRNADPDEIAHHGNIPRTLADRVKQEMQ